MDHIDQMKDETIAMIRCLVQESGKVVYVSGIAEDDGDQVKTCRSHGLIEYSIPVTDPFLRDH